MPARTIEPTSDWLGLLAENLAGPHLDSRIVFTTTLEGLSGQRTETDVLAHLVGIDHRSSTTVLHVRPADDSGIGAQAFTVPHEAHVYLHSGPWDPARTRALLHSFHLPSGATSVTENGAGLDRGHLGAGVVCDVVLDGGVPALVRGRLDSFVQDGHGTEVRLTDPDSRENPPAPFRLVEGGAVHLNRHSIHLTRKAS